MARMTFYHKELLVDFIEMNRSMVRGKSRGECAEAEESRRLWEEAAARLSAAGAVKRSGDEWKKAWGELLCRTKKMARMYSRGRDAHKKLTPLDHRILAAGQGNLLLKAVNGDLSTAKRRRKSEELMVKAELPIEEDRDASDDDDDDVPLHPPPPGRMDEAKECGSTLQGPSPPPSPTHNIKTERKTLDPSLDVSEVYPKWLIEVERTRAQTERRRARAASRCADAITKMADAARVQADALMKMADASSLQAEAIMRIAKSFEKKGS